MPCPGIGLYWKIICKKTSLFVLDWGVKKGKCVSAYLRSDFNIADIHCSCRSIHSDSHHRSTHLPLASVPGEAGIDVPLEALNRGCCQHDCFCFLQKQWKRGSTVQIWVQWSQKYISLCLVKGDINRAVAEDETVFGNFETFSPKSVNSNEFTWTDLNAFLISKRKLFFFKHKLWLINKHE